MKYLLKPTAVSKDLNHNPTLELNFLKTGKKESYVFRDYFIKNKCISKIS